MLNIVFNCLKSAPDHFLNLIFETKEFALKILYKLFQLKLYFKLTNQLLPQYLYSFDLKTNHDIHLHNTRQRHKLHITRVKHEFAKRCIRYQLPSEINLTPTLITDKINTHSFNGFSNYAKTYMISKYPANCTLLN